MGNLHLKCSYIKKHKSHRGRRLALTRLINILSTFALAHIMSHSQRGQACTRRNRFRGDMWRWWDLAFGGSYTDPPPATELDFLGDLHKWLVAAGEIPYIPYVRAHWSPGHWQWNEKENSVGWIWFLFSFFFDDNSMRWWRSIFRLLGRDTQTQSVVVGERRKWVNL